MYIVLGQLFGLHVCFSRPLPPHVLPPYAGAGLVHGFVLDILPPPQLTEHPDQPAHADHLPSTINIRFKYDILSLFGRVGFC